MDVRRSRTKDTGEWIATCPEVSRPVCEGLLELIFHWEPDLEESINTNMLCYSGRKCIVALGAFKHKACITFFRGAELDDPKHLFNHGENNVSIRNILLTTLEGFPQQAFKALLRNGRSGGRRFRNRGESRRDGFSSARWDCPCRQDWHSG